MGAEAGAPMTAAYGMPAGAPGMPYAQHPAVGVGYGGFAHEQQAAHWPPAGAPGGHAGGAHGAHGVAPPGAMLEPGVPPHLSGLMAPPPLEGADAAGAEAAALGYGSHGRPPALSNPEMVAFYRMQEADERRTKRLARNRTSARLRRMRKKTMVRDATRPARPRAPARAGAAARE